LAQPSLNQSPIAPQNVEKPPEKSCGKAARLGLERTAGKSVEGQASSARGRLAAGTNGMRRFSSMKFAVAETRRILRDRFARYLPVIQNAAAAPGHGNLIPDEQLLHLLLGLDILCESDIDRARATYDAASPPGIDEPSLDELIAAGWIRVVWDGLRLPSRLTGVRASSQATT
jgi:hypothetical protein